MSVDCVHGSFASRDNCPDCRMDRIEALLQRIADAVAPTPDQRARQIEDIGWRRSERHLRESGGRR